MHNIFTVWRSIKMQSLSQTKIILWLRKCIHISPLTRLVIPFFFLNSLVYFDSCSQSKPPSKVGALYHNFYGNSWIISELDCLMHKMDSSWKPFSSWLYNVYVEYIINAAEFLTIVHLLWLSTDVIAPFLSRFLSRLSVHKYNNNNIASVITAIST